MTVCLCGLLVATLSAMSADLDTTRQFTASGAGVELNPVARPFVEGRGARGEAVLGMVSAMAWLRVDRWPEPWRSSLMLAGWSIHAALALNHERVLGADVPVVMLPVLAVRW